MHFETKKNKSLFKTFKGVSLPPPHFSPIILEWPYSTRTASIRWRYISNSQKGLGCWDVTSLAPFPSHARTHAHTHTHINTHTLIHAQTHRTIVRMGFFSWNWMRRGFLCLHCFVETDSNYTTSVNTKARWQRRTTFFHLTDKVTLYL